MFKLMFRGILRHKAMGKKLFVLLALCTQALIFTLSFRDSFTDRYTDLAIETVTGHLMVVSPQSPILSDSKLFSQESELHLIRPDPELERLVASWPEVRAAGPVLSTVGVNFHLSSDYESDFQLRGVRPGDFARLFPGVVIVEGRPEIRWNESLPDVPVIRNRLEPRQNQPQDDKIVPEDLRLRDEPLERFKIRISGEWPELFSGVPILGKAGDQAFLQALSAALHRSDLPALAERIPQARYDYRLDDALAALRSPGSEELLPLLRKRLLQALYPQAIRPVRERTRLNVPLTLQVPPAKNEGLFARNRVIPIRYVAIASGMPLYWGTNYIDIAVLRRELGIGEQEATSYQILLKDRSFVGTVKPRLENYLAERGLDWTVADYAKTGRIYGATTTAIEVITFCLILLFVATLIVFVVNSVMLSLLKRRREIGTGLALGLTPGRTMGLFLGEVFFVVSFSWVIGAVLGALVTGYFAWFGMPGMLFFPLDKLYLTLTPRHFLLSYLIVLSASWGAALIPLWGLRKRQPIDLLKEVV